MIYDVPYGERMVALPGFRKGRDRCDVWFPTADLLVRQVTTDPGAVLSLRDDTHGVAILFEGMDRVPVDDVLIRARSSRGDGLRMPLAEVLRRSAATDLPLDPRDPTVVTLTPDDPPHVFDAFQSGRQVIEISVAGDPDDPPPVTVRAGNGGERLILVGGAAAAIVRNDSYVVPSDIRLIVRSASQDSGRLA